ncbi:MAG: DNA polymerase IV, partial [Coriobacteriaceae bacterium]|nr:DNA polymerase IV [Coriobacteriaceae bacterium]
LSGFTEPRARQMDLFEEVPDSNSQPRDQEALSRLTDALRDRFGDDAVSYGRDLRFRGHTTGTAPMGKNDD